MKWELVRKLKSTHRIFRCVDTGQLAICDNSGAVPDEADDGALWFDAERPLQLGAKQLVVPLQDDAGRPTATLVVPQDVLPLLDLVPAWPVQLTAEARGLRTLFEALDARAIDIDSLNGIKLDE